MLLIKMNLKNKTIKKIIINHTNINIIFENNNGFCPLHIQMNKHQIKQIYNKVKNNDKKLNKLKQDWKYKR